MKTKNKLSKMRNCIFKSLFILAFIKVNSVHSFEISDYEKKIKTNYNITSITEKISRDNLERNLREFLSSGRPSRFVGSEGHANALSYLEEKLKSFKSKGASYKKMPFDLTKNESSALLSEKYKNLSKVLNSLNEKKGYNLVWEKKGLVSPSEVIILGAHYDTISIDPKTMMINEKASMPGADNNGTGVAALLSMIEILDKLDLPKTVRIVFFDFEELGFYGSSAYVHNLKQNIGTDKIVGFINVMMLGNDSKRDDKEKKLNNMKIYLREPLSKGADEDLKILSAVTDNGKRLHGQIEFKPEAGGMNLGAHHSFWEANIPAICMSQNWESDLNPRQHTPNDFVETLNINTYTNAFRYITGSVLAWNYGIVK